MRDNARVAASAAKATYSTPRSMGGTGDRVCGEVTNINIGYYEKKYLLSIWGSYAAGLLTLFDRDEGWRPCLGMD